MQTRLGVHLLMIGTHFSSQWQMCHGNGNGCRCFVRRRRLIPTPLTPIEYILISCCYVQSLSRVIACLSRLEIHIRLYYTCYSRWIKMLRQSSCLITYLK